MGRGLIMYEFPDSGHESECVLFSAHLNYRLPDGERLHVRQTVAWCQSCGRFSLAERIESVADIEAELPGLIAQKDQLLAESLRQSAANQDMRRRDILGIGFDLDWTERAIAEVPVRIAWRRKRQSPAKCLHCGTSNLLEIDDRVEVIHSRIRTMENVSYHQMDSRPRKNGMPSLRLKVNSSGPTTGSMVDATRRSARSRGAFRRSPWHRRRDGSR